MSAIVCEPAAIVPFMVAAIVLLIAGAIVAAMVLFIMLVAAMVLLMVAFIIVAAMVPLIILVAAMVLLIIVGGINTVSMMWMTPLLAIMSAVVTLAVPFSVTVLPCADVAPGKTPKQTTAANRAKTSLRDI